MTLSYGVSHHLITRGMAAMYFLAFLGAFYQWEGLLGEHGLVPARDFVNRLKDHYGCIPKAHEFPFEECLRGFWKHPSIFWFVDFNDASFRCLLWVGLSFSAASAIHGPKGTSMLTWWILWMSYFSVVTSAGGSSFYQYGWESQLLETGFLVMWLCQNWMIPSFDIQPSSPIVWYLFRWLLFRISMGAGMIKIRGDSCWTEKTCLLYHFETQPIPSPLSFVFHFLPPGVLQRAVDLDLLVQVYTSWFVLLPTNTKATLFLVRLGGWIQCGFMINIALSGNMSMLNHLTILPTLACFDDDCYPHCLQRVFGDRNEKQPPIRRRFWMDCALLLLIGNLSRPVVHNLLGNDQQQIMNASFDSFRLVNTYGAFGSVGKQRIEPILSVGYKKPAAVVAVGDATAVEWIELDFPCKPGSLDRRPCFCAPYHYRLDWNIWFLGFQPHKAMLQQRETWVYSLLQKILTMDGSVRLHEPWLDLLDSSSRNLLLEKGAPLFAKVDMYRYEMAGPLWEQLFLVGERTRWWWKRDYEEVLIPPVSFDRSRNRLVLA